MSQVGSGHCLSITSIIVTILIGVGRFRILGGQGLKYWGCQGGPNSQLAHDVEMTSM